ncbi:MAG: MarR family transcriptional regulator [Clostridia bacterium]|nr:MarR family transcriptional regulator [Clostridia bacterium]
MPSLMRYINIVSRCAAIWRADKLEGTELGDQHYTYIITVCRNPGISQDAIARKLFINKSNVTRSLSYLETHGFVTREQSSEDRRITLVYPTEKAHDILPTVRSIIRGWNAYITEGFTEEELEMYMDMTARLAARAADYAKLSSDAYSDLESVIHKPKKGDSE